MWYRQNSLQRLSQKTFPTLECQSWGKLWGLWGFYSSVELTSVPWRRGPFLVGKILINTHILRDPFLIGILLIRVNRGEQDVSLYTHVWRPSNAMLDLSKVSLSPLASFCQLLISSRRSSRLIQVSLILRWRHQPWGGVVYFQIGCHA